MENIREILIANISMAIFLQATKHYCDKHMEKTLSDSQKNDFTDLGKQAIEKHTWKCYLPTSKMGKSNRGVNIPDARDLCQYIKHIDDIHLIKYYKNFPLSVLENISVQIVFLEYEKNEVTEQLKNILFIKSILKSTANNGSIDVLKREEALRKILPKVKELETELESELESESESKDKDKDKDKDVITFYINCQGKHPLASFLDMNPRTLNSFGGNKNAKK